MASMNNWLAFSLSSQDQPNPSQTPHLISVATATDVSGDCYVDDPPMGIPTLRNDASFGFLEAFHRPQQQTPDWNLKNLDFKGAGASSELSMLVGSGSSYQNHAGIHDENQPKLEDFLGGNSSFSDHDQKVLPEYMFSNSSSSFPVQDASILANDHAAGGLVHAVRSSPSSSSNNNHSIGLSMIKTWLGNQPAGAVVVHQQHANNRSNNNHETPAAAGASSSSPGNAMNAYVNTQALSLSMSTGSQPNGGGASLPLLPAAGMIGGGGGESSCANDKQKGVGGGQLDAQAGAIEEVSRKPVDTFGQRTSIYRGVTRHRWTGRYEAHLWDNSCKREGQTRKGRQVYLGGYDKEDKAARAYDLAALKYWGPTTTTNFPISNYEKELEEMKHMTRQEFVASLRRKSSGFSRGASIYRGVTRHHQHGRWQARIGRVAGNKDLYLGTFSTQEEAAEAYDIAAIKFRGLNAVTNFDMSRYDVKSILESNTLPIGGTAKRLKDVAVAGDEPSEASVHGHLIRAAADDHHHHLLGPSGHFDAGGYGWPTIAFHHPPPAEPAPLALQYHPYPPPQQRGWCKPEQDAAHGMHDLQQLHLANAHNFFHHSAPDNAVLHNLVGLDPSSSSLEPGTGSNPAIYNAGGYQGGGYQGGGYVMPIPTADHQGMDTDGNAYYLAQHLDTNNATWMSGQATISKPASGGIAGPPLFRVWNNDA